MTKKKAPPTSGKKQQTAFMSGLYALALIAWAYLLGSMAIDNGSLIFYGFASVSLYWAVHFAKRAFTNR